MFAYAYAYAYAYALAERPSVGSVLARMREGGLSAEEFETMFFLFAVAGNETLRNGLPGGLHTLLAHPDAIGAVDHTGPELRPF
ncbi:hypothetical protein [Kitasatospora sp. GP82]|uniref:hypothetical protein n=1 Tax=Kitasatospora sp. GP82 TaxID=3035089 RepID=UPI002473C90A|nr:hypothetical protein [Kitasatospora sp. GP82]MDH6124741.1 cytochrome P450 [Kitasatospora sp. GP82]